MFYCCLNQLFVVLSVHFGLGPIKRIGMVELHQWVHLFVWHLLHPDVDLQLSCTQAGAFTHLCAPLQYQQTDAQVVEKTHSRACTSIHTCQKCVGAILTYFSLSNKHTHTHAFTEERHSRLQRHPFTHFTPREDHYPDDL